MAVAAFFAGVLVTMIVFACAFAIAAFLPSAFATAAIFAGVFVIAIVFAGAFATAAVFAGVFATAAFLADVFAATAFTAAALMERVIAIALTKVGRCLEFGGQGTTRRPIEEGSGC